MIWYVISTLAALLALIPLLLVWRNLSAYAPPPEVVPDGPPPFSPVSVLIPARDEAANIEAAVESVLDNRGIELEVVVLDDGSEDGTDQLVRNMAARDNRVRLEIAPPLPPGWAGKHHACQVLSGLARHSLLVFMDADVRLSNTALARMAAFMKESNADLASGVPRQITGTWAEKLLIPLIHFVLLGYLPVRRMRQSPDPAFGAGCGQLMVARAPAYVSAGGHAAIRNSWHDGLKLPRAFRLAGLRTDLFDAAEVCTCRMYHGAKEVFDGLAKNATEGLAAPRMILPATLMLGGSAILPWLLLPALPWMPAAASGITLFALLGSLAPRFPLAMRFRQSMVSACLHPIGILLFLAIQWTAFFRSLRGQASTWKGRSYASSPAPDAAPEQEPTP